MVQLLDAGHRAQYFPGVASLGILRLDLPDPVAGGNKSYKLKYHLEAFRNSGAKNLLTFGGAYSNHIAAMAYAGRVNNIPTTGIIRGDELSKRANKVLEFASSCGMELQFVSREEYRQRYAKEYHEHLGQEFPQSYVVPEGGGGEAGIRGCMEILNEGTDRFDEIVLPVGTGTACEGIRRSLKAHQQVTGIDVVNRGAEFSLGGYAKTSNGLEDFIRTIRDEIDLPLDHVYSGKTLFAIHKMATAGSFLGKNLLFVHTGGYAFVK